MKLRLVLTDLADAPRADVLGLPIPALAWTTGDGTIRVVSPFHRILFPRRRIAHEVEHNLAPDFSENADHHKPLHFCGRVGHALRLTDAHLSPRSLELADELLQTGVADSEG